MIEPEDLLQQKVILDDTYQIWSCQRIESEPDSKQGVVVFTGTVAPLCGSCGREPKQFAVRFRKEELGGGFKARDKVVLAITDQLDE